LGSKRVDVTHIHQKNCVYDGSDEPEASATEPITNKTHLDVESSDVETTIGSEIAVAGFLILFRRSRFRLVRTLSNSIP